MRKGYAGWIGLSLLATACSGAHGTAGPAANSVAAPVAPATQMSCSRAHPGTGPMRISAVRESSTVALVKQGSSTFAYVADADEDLLHTIDVAKGEETAVTPLGGSPAQVLVLADGRVAVTLRDKNRIQLLEPGAGAHDELTPLCSVALASEPFGMAVAPDEQRMVVTSAWGKTLTALDTATLKVDFEVPVSREPRAVLIDEEGKRAFVAHVVGATMSVVDLTGEKHEARSIDLKAKVNERGMSGKVRGGCQGFALAKVVELPKERESTENLGEKPLVKGQAPKDIRRVPAKPRGRIMAPMVTVDPGESTARSSGYGNSFALTPPEAPMVSVVDEAAERTLTKELLVDGGRHQAECLLPRGAAVNSETGSLYVTCLGIDAVLELDARGVDPMRLERRRFSVPSGPMGIAVDEQAKKAVVWSEFDREVAVIDLDGKKPGKGDAVTRIATSRRAKSRMTVEAAWGRKLFHKTDDDRVSNDGRACASCHPDGREDALTWSTPDGPRQTIMLAGRLASSAPFGWFGSHDTLKTHVTETFRRLSGTGLPDAPGSFDEMDALLAYVGSMRGPEMEGARVPDGEKELAKHGKELFFDEKQGCATCHLGGAGTDSRKHDVSSTGVMETKGTTFDTPSLRFVSGTAPYFHDGRYATLEDLLAGSDTTMGHTLQLSREDVIALKAYMETL